MIIRIRETNIQPLIYPCANSTAKGGFSLAFLKSLLIFPAQFFQYRKDAEMTKNKMPVKEFLPLLGVTCAAFIFNTSEFMPIGLLTGICIAKRKARQPA